MNRIMVKKFDVSGMSCMHCVAHVKQALETLPGVKADVTLEPGMATVEFLGEEYSLEKLQGTVSEEAGDYILSERK